MIEITVNKCDFCGSCVAVCPVDCIELKEFEISINHALCIDCDLCAIICPIEVLESVAQEKV